jgi:hypothetical protein
VTSTVVIVRRGLAGLELGEGAVSGDTETRSVEAPPRVNPTECREGARAVYPSPFLSARRIGADYNSMSLLSHTILFFIIPEFS